MNVVTGARYKLTVETLAIEDVNGKCCAVTIPPGEIIRVTAGPETGDGMIDVLWNGRVLEVSLMDVSARGTEVTDQSARA